MKISIITVVRNSQGTIGDCLLSVATQTHPDVEHVVVDGASTDGTLEVIRKKGTHVATFISEPDTGIYNALNKAIALCTGSIIGILHADDVFYDSSILARVAEVFGHQEVDACYGDLEYVARDNIHSIFRMWKSKPFSPGMILRGWMPAHPTVFLRRELYSRYGGFNERFHISADYDLMVRLFHKYAIHSQYIPCTFTRMRVGGASNRSLTNIIRKTSEDLQSLRMNGFSFERWFIVLCKNLRKVSQFFPPQHENGN